MPTFLSPRIHSRVGWVLLLLLFLVSVVPAEISSATVIPGLDKVFHFCAYASMMFWFVQLSHDPRRLGLSLFAYGLFIEAVQFYLPYRSASWLDTLANGTGILFALLIAAHTATGFRRRRQGQ